MRECSFGLSAIKRQMYPANANPEQPIKNNDLDYISHAVIFGMKNVNNFY